MSGSCAVSGTDGWTDFKQFTCEVSGAAGVHTLYLVFEGGDGFLMNADSFIFKAGKSTGDLNDDGNTDAQDAVLMLNHLLTKKALTAEQAARADLNGDGKITAADLSLLKGMIR